MKPRSLDKQIKITKRLILILSIFPQGSETFIVNKFLGLLARGWDVHILCNKINKKAWSAFSALAANPSKKRVHTTPPHQPKWLAVILFPIEWFTCLVTAPRETWRYLKSGWSQFRWDVLKHFYLDAPLLRLHPDILHFEFGSLAVGRTYLKNLLNTKMSVSFRGYDLNYIGLNDPNYYQDVWDRIDAAHFLGEDLWQRAQKRGAPKDLHRSLIPPAVDLPKFPEIAVRKYEKLGIAENPIKILSVGRLHWKKGYEFTLQAVKALMERGVKCEYRIIGIGDYKNCLYFTRHQLGLEKVVQFCGGLSHVHVLDYMQWADVFLHGAVSEGFCNAVLEAQAMCVPVVCTDADGLRENIEDGITGFVVPRRDPKAMVEKLVLLAKDGHLRQQMGLAGRQRVETHFQIASQLDAFETFYEQL